MVQTTPTRLVISTPAIRFPSIAPLKMSGRRSLLAVMDQALFSGAGLILNAVLARVLSPAAYGGFALGFLIFVACSGFHNVLILEPMSVIGPAAHPRHPMEYLLAQVKVHVCLSAVLGSALLAAAMLMHIGHFGQQLSSAILGAGVTLPVVLLFWLGRRFCYVQQSPGRAFVGSGLYLLTVLASLFVSYELAVLNPFSAFCCMAAGAVVGSIPFVVGIRHSVQRSERVSWARVLAENWRYGRWLLATAVLFPIATQVQVFLIGGLVGLQAAGVLRAVQLPSLVMAQAIVAIGTLELPMMASLFGAGNVARVCKKGMAVTISLTALACAYELILFVGAKRIEHLLYAGKFAGEAWLIAAFGLTPILSALVTGYGIVLRAMRRPQFDLAVNMIAAPFGVVSAFVLIRLWGLGGAVASNVLTTALSLAVIVYFYRKITSTPAEALATVHSVVHIRGEA